MKARLITLWKFFNLKFVVLLSWLRDAIKGDVINVPYERGLVMKTPFTVGDMTPQ